MLHIYQESGRGVIQLPKQKVVLWLGKGMVAQFKILIRTIPLVGEREGRLCPGEPPKIAIRETFLGFLKI
jgi:hypothetical protein